MTNRTINKPTITWQQILHTATPSVKGALYLGATIMLYIGLLSTVQNAITAYHFTAQLITLPVLVAAFWFGASMLTVRCLHCYHTFFNRMRDKPDPAAPFGGGGPGGGKGD